MLDYIRGASSVGLIVLGWQWVELITHVFAPGWYANTGVIVLLVIAYILGATSSKARG